MPLDIGFAIVHPIVGSIRGLIIRFTTPFVIIYSAFVNALIVLAI
jgi:hypothetical protein